MAKKKQLKKHKLKHGEPAAPVVTAGKEASKPKLKGSVALSGISKAVTGSGTETTRDFSYVGGDLRKILVLAVSLVGVEVVLWFLFGHTGLGSAVYRSIRP